jgi:hypothetical protein
MNGDSYRLKQVIYLGPDPRRVFDRYVFLALAVFGQHRAWCLGRHGRVGNNHKRQTVLLARVLLGENGISGTARVRGEMQCVATESGCNYVICSFAWGNFVARALDEVMETELVKVERS